MNLKYTLISPPLHLAFSLLPLRASLIRVFILFCFYLFFFFGWFNSDYGYGGVVSVWIMGKRKAK